MLMILQDPHRNLRRWYPAIDSSSTYLQIDLSFSARVPFPTMH
jgi:hypothetical protein